MDGTRPNTPTDPRVMARDWDFHNPRAFPAAVVTLHILFGAFAALFTFILESVLALGWLGLLVIFDLLFAGMVIANRGWSGNWSLDVFLPGERVRPAIFRALTKSGLEWKEGLDLNAPRYFRSFKGPMEIDTPRVQLWTRSWRFEGAKGGPPREFTMVVLRPMREGEPLDPLKTALLAEIRNEVSG